MFPFLSLYPNKDISYKVIFDIYWKSKSNVRKKKKKIIIPRTHERYYKCNKNITKNVVLSIYFILIYFFINKINRKIHVIIVN